MMREALGGDSGTVSWIFAKTKQNASNSCHEMTDLRPQTKLVLFRPSGVSSSICCISMIRRGNTTVIIMKYCKKVSTQSIQKWHFLSHTQHHFETARDLEISAAKNLILLLVPRCDSNPPWSGHSSRALGGEGVRSPNGNRIFKIPRMRLNLSPQNE